MGEASAKPQIREAFGVNHVAESKPGKDDIPYSSERTHNSREQSIGSKSLYHRMKKRTLGKKTMEK